MCADRSAPGDFDDDLGDPATAGDANNAFALDLYRRWPGQEANCCFSPLGIRTVLALAENGARGETQRELREALRLPARESAADEGVTLLLQLAKEQRRAMSEISIENAAWVQQGTELAPAFADVAVKRFGASVEVADFRRAPEAARRAINAFISDQTRGRIQELLVPPSPLPGTRLMLLNTVYLKAPWAHEFEGGATRDERFFHADGGESLVRMMHRRVRVPYRRGPGYECVSLPYHDYRFKMLLILPQARDWLPRIEASLTAAEVRECLAPNVTEWVDLALPRFRIGGAASDVASALQELGIRKAFTPEAELAGINGKAPPDPEALYISSILHQAWIDVAEEGTEAAAATTMEFALSMPEPAPTPKNVIVFRADRPFLYALYESTSGAILFLGRVMAPPSVGGRERDSAARPAALRLLDRDALR